MSIRYESWLDVTAKDPDRSPRSDRKTPYPTALTVTPVPDGTGFASNVGKAFSYVPLGMPVRVVTDFFVFINTLTNHPIQSRKHRAETV